MKIIIDMQGVQTDSRHRGIGRYCLAVTRAFVDLANGEHDTRLLFNAALEGIDEAIETFAMHGRSASFRTVGPIRNTSSDNGKNDIRRDAAEHVYTHALDVGHPDVVWLSSVLEGFTSDALVPHAAPDAFTVATLYDLIPLHDRQYLGNSRARDWYMQRIEVLKRCDLLLAISEWVRSDAIKRLGIDPNRIVAIGAGVEPHFSPGPPGICHSTWLAERFGIHRSFVMYSGGFDKRKNVLALVEAYAALPPSLREQHMLVVVGRIDSLMTERFAKAMTRLHLGPDEVVFTNFVSDDELVRLYQSCALFAFPSESEGFGLPPLEAMACGAPVLVNDATSLPEVVGNREALFDGNRPSEMAARMKAVLTDAALADRLRRSGMKRAAHFSWRAVASRALAAIELHTQGEPRVAPAKATGSPWLPLYRMDVGNVVATLPKLRQWPGHVIWSGPLPAVGPASAPDRFRLGGYARLQHECIDEEWMTLIKFDAIGLVRAETFTGDALARHLSQLEKEHPLARQRGVEQIIGDSFAPRLTDDDLALIADSLARAAPNKDVRWLVDVTHIATNDLGTGVHRVVRSILREWLLDPPKDVRIEPIEFRDGRFHHAHDYACQLIGANPDAPLPGDIVAITGNELYIGLDWAMESLPSSASLLRTWRRAGVPIHFIVYDLLPLAMPDAFHPQSRESFTRWMETIADLGDVLHCISRTTASDVDIWLRQHELNRLPEVRHFELGVEPEEKRQEGILDPMLESAMSSAPSLLMVGTLEPRKGHDQVLGAAELLWESGAHFNLVIVGHRGWLVKDLIQRLDQHAERGRRLFWLDDADDPTLEAVYRRATALIAASRGEGYGLPLIEAAQRKKPVIARSLPVFREVAGFYPSYFDTNTAEGLATHIARWLAHPPRAGAPPFMRSWKESAASLMEAVGLSGQLL